MLSRCAARASPHEGGLFGAVGAMVVARSYRPPKAKLSTKKSVKKRFALTPNGKIKYWPSQWSGKARFVVPSGNWGHIADLLQPSQGNRAKWGQPAVKKHDLVEVVMAARRRFKLVQGRELREDEIAKLVEVVKTCRFVGNRVIPAEGTAPLSFSKT